MIEPVIKVCGVREQSVLIAAIEAGATAVGLNFVDRSRRRIDTRSAGELLDWARRRYGRLPTLFGVFADANPDRVRAMRKRLGLQWVQLHGDEPPDQVVALQPALKALGLSADDDIEAMGDYSDGLLMVDARAGGLVGGTGKTIPIELLERACRRRRLVVAGGLSAANVGELIKRVAPAGVDTASGAEDDRGKPSAEAAYAFVRAARTAFDEIREERHV